MTADRNEREISHKDVESFGAIKHLETAHGQLEEACEHLSGSDKWWIETMTRELDSATESLRENWVREND